MGTIGCFYVKYFFQLIFTDACNISKECSALFLAVSLTISITLSTSVTVSHPE